MKLLRVKCQQHKCLDDGASLRPKDLLKLAILNHLLIDARGQWTIDEVSIGMRSAGNLRVGAVSVSGIQIGEGGASCVVA